VVIVQVIAPVVVTPVNTVISLAAVMLCVPIPALNSQPAGAERIIVVAVWFAGRSVTSHSCIWIVPSVVHTGATALAALSEGRFVPNVAGVIVTAAYVTVDHAIIHETKSTMRHRRFIVLCIGNR
jgi:hypothetical protein